MDGSSKIAILIPCYNEEENIAKVVADFRREIPAAVVYVYDNNSTDGTADAARAAGAVVRHEPRQGKGNVVRSMLREVVADYYVLVDGDDTYPADSVQEMLAVAESGADLVVGDRLSNGTYRSANKRDFHTFGNQLVLFLINHLYGTNLADIMSGYRVLSRRFVRMYPALCSGFQLETDMTIFALSRKLRIAEVPVVYRDRPAGSQSKLSTYSDGLRVLAAIFNLYRLFHPLRYFSTIAGVLLIAGALVGTPVLLEFYETQFITKIPSAVLASGLVILASITFLGGLILDAINKSDQEEFERELKKGE
jgi:glycosyltransferase involved in cell wall biosynthesis